MKTILWLFLLVSAVQATTWTCTRDFSTVQLTYYETVGACTGSGNYTTSGGDPLGVSATSSATAQAVCGSNAQILVDLLTTTSADGTAVANAVCGFDHTNFKYKCSVQGTAGAGNAMVETSMAAVPAPFRYRAVCK